MAQNQRSHIADALLGWYDAHHRELPWRVPPRHIARAVQPDPYRIWLSEIMLQQTTVEAVKPYFAKFVTQWPNITALAAAPEDDIMKAGAGLGYYSRARNLKKCADFIASTLDGIFPDTEEGLRTLPGVGPYTSAAIAAIAFNRPAAVVDGNVERVFSRLFTITTPLPSAKKEIHRLVSDVLPHDRPGDFAQAVMDLGATLCSPRRPKCMLCPLKETCLALKEGEPELYPVKAAKPEKPMRRGAAFVAVRDDGAILLRKRPGRGLLAGMSEPPNTDWNARQDGETSASAAPFEADWQYASTIKHVFTHFELRLDVFRADGAVRDMPQDWWWSSPDTLLSEALPSVMKKAIEAAIPTATKRARSTSQ